jgi:hypothetical protein
VATHVAQPGPPVRVITARAVGLVLASVALWDGAGLIAGRDAAVQTPSWAVLRAFPGTTAMGLIYVATAVILIYALARPGELLAWVLSGGMCLYLVVAVSFFASWAVTGGQIVWTAPSKPLGLAVFWLLVLLARPIPPAMEAPTRGRG